MVVDSPRRVHIRQYEIAGSVSGTSLAATLSALNEVDYPVEGAAVSNEAVEAALLQWVRLVTTPGRLELAAKFFQVCLMP